jgi:glycosyltransferase involved in cell wall biosynthesis
MRVAMLVNIPAPYRVPVYDRMAAALGKNFRVLYMAATERDRRWNVPPLSHDHRFLRGPSLRVGEREIHFRQGVMRELRTFRPDVVMTGGFNPPMLLAWLYSQATGVAHVPVSDAWLRSEASLSWVHRGVRRSVYRTSRAYVGASKKTLELYESYGEHTNLFLSPLCIDNSRFRTNAGPLREREYDLVFSGNLIDRKLPLFFADVAATLGRKRGSVAVLVIGDGPLRRDLEAALAREPSVRATFAGFLQQDELPLSYARGKIFCFPTRNDPWGVVANEACAAGLPVVTCENAGCAGELVIHDRNGYVLPLVIARWADALDQLLSSPTLLERMSVEAQSIVSHFNFDAATEGLMGACRVSLT